MGSDARRLDQKDRGTEMDLGPKLDPLMLVNNRILSLGGGTYGSVYLLDDSIGIEPVGKKKIVKIMPRSKTSWKTFLSEVTVIKFFTDYNMTFAPKYYGWSATGELPYTRQPQSTFGASSNSGGSWFLVMEYVQGESLCQWIQSRDPHRRQREAASMTDVMQELSEFDLFDSQCVAVGKQLLWAARVAHDFGIVHRDLKPDNIFVREGDPSGVPEVVLIDWGLSCSNNISDVTKCSNTVGTPYYISPEIAQGISGFPIASDYWSCGVALYYCITKRRVVRGKEISELVDKLVHYEEQAYVIDKLPQTSELINACLKVDPTRRLRAVDDLLDSRVSDPEPVVLRFEPIHPFFGGT